MYIEVLRGSKGKKEKRANGWSEGVRENRREVGKEKRRNK